MKTNYEIKRLGETIVQKSGEIACIVEYNNASDMVIQFKLTNELVRCSYKKFKKGEVKSPFAPSVFGIGVRGLEPTRDENGNTLDSYVCWRNMLKRCYYEKYQEKNLAYIGCSVSSEWLLYTNFKKWYDDNYYKIKNEIITLDKDILKKGNKVYSSNTCIFVPQYINSLFTKCTATRGDSPLGVGLHSRKNKYTSQCEVNGIRKYLGVYNTEIEAFNVYKQFKEDYIKQIANEYKLLIPLQLYEAMISYKIEITD